MNCRSPRPAPRATRRNTIQLGMVYFDNLRSVSLLSRPTTNGFRHWMPQVSTYHPWPTSRVELRASTAAADKYNMRAVRAHKHSGQRRPQGTHRMTSAAASAVVRPSSCRPASTPKEPTAMPRPANAAMGQQFVVLLTRYVQISLHSISLVPGLHKPAARVLWKAAASGKIVLLLTDAVPAGIIPS